MVGRDRTNLALTSSLRVEGGPFSAILQCIYSPGANSLYLAGHLLLNFCFASEIHHVESVQYLPLNLASGSVSLVGEMVVITHTR